MNASVAVLEISFEVLLVFRPRQSIYSRCSVFPKLEERLIEQIDADVVEERGELLLFPFLWYLPYEEQRLGHTFLVLRYAIPLLANHALTVHTRPLPPRDGRQRHTAVEPP